MQRYRQPLIPVTPELGHSFDEFSKHVSQIFYMPLSTEATALFVAFLFERGLAIGTIHSHLSSISYYHRMAGFPTATDSFFVNKVLKGASNHFPSIDRRYPITLPILNSILEIIPSLAPNFYLRTLYSAMASTAFYAFLRCSKMCASPHNLQFHQLAISHDHSSAEITFIHFKHSISNRPFIIRIERKDTFCPILLLLAYLSARGQRPGPLFCTVDNNPIPRAKFTIFLSSVFQLLNLSLKHYKIHSFRIGAATSALLQGKSESEIQILGRCSSSAFKRYLRLAAVSSV